MQFNILEAKTQLSKLVEAALRGEEVVIANRGKPAVRLVKVEPATPRRAGAWAGLMTEAEIDHAFSPEVDAQIAREWLVPKIQILTIEDLLAGKKPQLPDLSRGEQTFKKARREKRDGKAHQPSLDF